MRSIVKNNWLLMGLITLAVAFGLIVYQVVLIFLDNSLEDNSLYFLALTLVSIALALIAIGISTQSDRKFAKILEAHQKVLESNQKVLESNQELLEAIQKDVKKLLYDPKQDTLSPEQKATRPTKEITVDDKNKAAAQRRLDEDTKKVGFQRGEIYQLPNGTWGIHWGGKYPL